MPTTTSTLPSEPSRSPADARTTLLLYPRCEPDWPDGHKLLGLPLAVLTVARPLVAAGFPVEIVDENIRHRPLDALREMETPPLFVGISCLGGGQIQGGLTAARAIRRRWKDVPIIWGGWSLTLLPHLWEDDELAQLVSAFVRGRGEGAVLEIAERLLRNEPSFDGVPGVTWRDADGGLIRNEDAELDDPKLAGPLPYHLIKHTDAYITRDRALNYMSSYGCPHRCAFCGIPAGTRTFRAIDNERVVDHLVAASDQLGVSTIVFYDDNFFTSTERVLDLATRLIERGAGLQWFSNGRIEQIARLTDPQLTLLRDSGCRGLNIGYETGDQSVADHAHKDTEVKAILPLVSRLHRVGIHPSLNFMIGLPGESPEQLARSLDTLHAIHAACPTIEVCWYMFMPAPGTPFWKALIEDGTLTEPRTLREHCRLQSLYLEHPWFYESPRADVYRERRHKHKAIAWYFYNAYAASPWPGPARWLFWPLRRLCRLRIARGWLRLRGDWWIAYQLQRLRVRARWTFASLRRTRVGALLSGEEHGPSADGSADASSRGSVVPWTHGTT